MIKKLLLSILILPFISCEDNGKNKDMTFLGGQIINPVSDYVILSNFETKKDTIRLDGTGSFAYNCETLENGLYMFRHGELQFFYIEKGDSLLFRVNTVDFDESLAFSGKGAAKNNFLTGLFLEDELVAEELPGFYKLPPKAYTAKIDSISRSLKQSLANLEENVPLSENFIKVAQGIINYNSYSQKERYISAKLHDNQDGALKKIPSDFYNFRKEIAFNDASLQNHYAYNRFLNMYLNNLAKSEITGNDSDVHFKEHKYKLQLIDSLVSNKKLKNNLLRYNLRRYLIHTHDASRDAELIALFNTLDTNKSHQDEIKQYAKTTSKLRRGETIPEIVLVNTDNESVLLKEILKRKTVIFFWTQNSIRHYKEIHARIAELKSKFPEYDYVGINTDSHFKKWQKTVRGAGYNKENEYQFENDTKSKNELLINSVNKTIIIDSNSQIIDTYSNVFNQAFEAKLLGYIN